MKKIAKLLLILVIALLITNQSSIGQISFSNEIKLPELNTAQGMGASPPRDIISANGHTYIYTFKGILVYRSGVSNYEGYIPFSDTTHGRLAIQDQNPV
jgi:hypothetical protein